MKDFPGTIALTGGTGFVGKQLINALVNEGWRVRALTRKPGLLPQNANIKEIHGVLEDKQTLFELVAGTDTVIHAGARLYGRNWREFESVNVNGTRNLINAIINQDQSPRIIYISSIAAREPSLSHYSASKRGGEKQLEDSTVSLNWQILRPPVVYGPGDKQTLNLFRQFSRGFSLELGSGGRFSMLYVDDLISAVRCLLLDKSRNSAIFELDDGHPGGYCWNDVVIEAGKKFDRTVKNIVVPKPAQYILATAASITATLVRNPPILNRGKINEMFHPDWISRNNLLNEATDWIPKVQLAEGISMTVDWYVEQGWL